MARKVITELIDDLDNSVIEDGDGGTVGFSLDTISYEIDLSTANQDKLRAALEPYIRVARRANSAAVTSRPRTKSNSNPDLAAVRRWARANGLTVSDRGRVPLAVLEAYQASA